MTQGSSAFLRDGIEGGMRLAATGKSTAIRLSPLKILDGQALAKLVDAAILEQSRQPKGSARVFGEADWEIVRMLWPHLDALAKLFDASLPAPAAYIAARWQVDHYNGKVRVQSHSGDRYDEALEVQGDFPNDEHRIAAAQAIADYLNDRLESRWKTVLLENKVLEQDREIERLRNLIARDAGANPTDGPMAEALKSLRTQRQDEASSVT